MQGNLYTISNRSSTQVLQFLVWSHWLYSPKGSAKALLMGPNWVIFPIIMCLVNGKLRFLFVYGSPPGKLVQKNLCLAFAWPIALPIALPVAFTYCVTLTFHIVLPIALPKITLQIIALPKGLNSLHQFFWHTECQHSVRTSLLSSHFGVQQKP